MSVRQTVVAQFRKPSGGLGAAAGWIMANRPSNRRRNAWTVSLLGLTPGARVLEWGCGPGIAVAACLKAEPAAQILAIDHSPVMAAQARRRNAPAIETDKAQIMVGDLSDAAGFAPFDAIFSCNVLQFAEDKAAALALMRRLLAPGGRVANTFQPRTGKARPEDALRWAEEVKAASENAGFVDVCIETLALKPVPAVCVTGRRGATN